MNTKRVSSQKISVKISTTNYKKLQKVRKLFGMPIRFMLDKAVEEYCEKKKIFSFKIGK